jgi:hypothetical protein
VKIRVANANNFAITGKVSGSSVLPKPMEARSIKLKARAFTVAAGAKKVVKLKLPTTLRRLLAFRGKLTLRLTGNVKDPAGNTRTVKRRVTPRLKR